jgi:hypothetical protein
MARKVSAHGYKMRHVSIESPQTQAQIIEAFEQQEVESVRYWSVFDSEAFFRRIGTSWSPAETVRHLTKSTRPVAKALTTPGLVLRIMFGKATRSSITYDALREQYLGMLAKGADAGRFAPSPRTESDPESFRRTIMDDFTRVQGDVRRAIARWSDAKLDRLQLPHPLLGKLTVREMLFFTLYHQRHHIGVVQRHLAS